MSHQTHNRSYQGQVFTGQMTQPTVSKAQTVKALKEDVQGLGFNPTRSTSPCYNNTTNSSSNVHGERKQISFDSDFTCPTIPINTKRDGRRMSISQTKLTRILLFNHRAVFCYDKMTCRILAFTLNISRQSSCSYGADPRNTNDDFHCR